MQTTTIADFVQGLEQPHRKPLLHRVMARFRVMRMESDLALIDPRLREDAGLQPPAPGPIRAAFGVAVGPLWSRRLAPEGAEPGRR